MRKQQHNGTVALKAINFLKPVAEDVLAAGEEGREASARALTAKLDAMTMEEIEDIGRSFDALFEIAALAQTMLAVHYVRRERRGSGVPAQTQATEKIDGTNASIFIGEDGAVHAASRTRWITPQDDNYGFARWVAEHEDAIREGLGVGHHFGEWYGSGIQRGYGLKNGEKRFALFNVQRWYDAINQDFVSRLDFDKMQTPPSFIDVVPIIGIGVFDTNAIIVAANELLQGGSVAVPGFMRPEGIVVYHKAGDVLFKYTFDKNDGHKGGGK